MNDSPYRLKKRDYTFNETCFKENWSTLIRDRYCLLLLVRCTGLFHQRGCVDQRKSMERGDISGCDNPSLVLLAFIWIRHIHIVYTLCRHVGKINNSGYSCIDFYEYGWRGGKMYKWWGNCARKVILGIGVDCWIETEFVAYIVTMYVYLNCSTVNANHFSI